MHTCIAFLSSYVIVLYSVLYVHCLLCVRAQRLDSLGSLDSGAVVEGLRLVSSLPTTRQAVTEHFMTKIIRENLYVEKFIMYHGERFAMII